MKSLILTHHSFTVFKKHVCLIKYFYFRRLKKLKIMRHHNMEVIVYFRKPVAWCHRQWSCEFVKLKIRIFLDGKWPECQRYKQTGEPQRQHVWWAERSQPETACRRKAALRCQPLRDEDRAAHPST